MYNKLETQLVINGVRYTNKLLLNGEAHTYRFFKIFVQFYNNIRYFNSEHLIYIYTQ